MDKKYEKVQKQIKNYIKQKPLISLPDTFRYEKIINFDQLEHKKLLESVQSLLKSNDLENYIPENENIFNYKFSKNIREKVAEDEEVCNQYEKLIKEVIAPHVLNEYNGLEDTILYQFPPSLRIYPSLNKERELGRMHSDDEYGHQDGEINFWMPLTKAYGNNTLWAETGPGLGNFHPFELEYGQIQRFNGTYCRHKTLPNDTGKTRISLDFRVVTLNSFDHEWKLPGCDYIHGRKKYTLIKPLN
jgi:hypothetical protein